MDEFIIGRFVVSSAGHDSGKYYVIKDMDQEYVYLVDGRIRTLDHPKKKKMKHVTIQEQSDQDLMVKIADDSVKNEEIKRAIKILQRMNPSKEGNAPDNK